jgi:hypothetical protein
MYSSESPSRIVPLVVLWNGFTVPILFPRTRASCSSVLTDFCLYFQGIRWGIPAFRRMAARGVGGVLVGSHSKRRCERFKRHSHEAL